MNGRLARLGIFWPIPAKAPLAMLVTVLELVGRLRLHVTLSLLGSRRVRGGKRGAEKILRDRAGKFSSTV
jgi:hypothetical protein